MVGRALPFGLPKAGWTVDGGREELALGSSRCA